MAKIKNGSSREDIGFVILKRPDDRGEEAVYTTPRKRREKARGKRKERFESYEKGKEALRS